MGRSCRRPPRCGTPGRRWCRLPTPRGSRSTVAAGSGRRGAAGVEHPHGAGAAVDLDDRARVVALRRTGVADHRGDAVLAGEDGEVAERAARLGHQARQAGHDGRQSGVEVGHDQHGTGRRVVADVHRPRGDPATGADVTAGRRRPAPPVPLGGEPELRRQGPRGRVARVDAVGEVHRDQAGPGGRAQLLELEDPHGVGVGEDPDAGEPLAELGGGAGRELLDPAGPEAQRLSHDRVVAGGDRRRHHMGRAVAQVDRHGGGSDGCGRFADPWRRQGQHDGVGLDDVVDRHALGPGLGQGGQGQRGRGDALAGVGHEHPRQGFVAVEGAQGRAPVVEHGEQGDVRELVHAGDLGEVAVDLLDHVAGQGGQCPGQPAGAPRGPEPAEPAVGDRACAASCGEPGPGRGGRGRRRPSRRCPARPAAAAGRPPMRSR